MTPSGALAPTEVTSSEATTGPVVSLVGAGPGDADLLTLRAEELLAAAGTVVTDAAVAHLAAACALGATVVIVADRLPAVDVLLAARPTPVVRLYSGDAWLHPAHGPEADALTAAGVPFEAVAGVASEIALPALAGIPVHVRHLAVACTIADGTDAPPATDPARTLVVVTADLHDAARAMAANGDPELPAAAFEATGGATYAALGDLTSLVPHRPGVLVTGAVAAYHRQAVPR